MQIGRAGRGRLQGFIHRFKGCGCSRSSNEGHGDPAVQGTTGRSFSRDVPLWRYCLS